MKRLKPLLILSAAFVLAANARAASDENLKLAREVIQLTQMDKMFDAMIPQIEAMQSQMLAPTLEKLPPEQKVKAEAFQKKLSKVTLDTVQGMLTKIDGIYAEVYSTGELQAMKAFFTSPEGHSMIAKQPALMQKMMPIVQGMQAELMPKIQAMVAEFQQEATSGAK